MLKRFVLLACILFVASAETSRAAPLDSPGTVYIDGVPCNLACQSYMAWSRRVRSEETAPAVSPSAPRQIVQRSQKTKTQRPATKTRASVASKAAPGRVAKNAASKDVASRPIATAPADAAPQPKREDEKTASSDRTASGDNTDSSGKTDAPATPNPASGPEAGNARDQVATSSTVDNSGAAAVATPLETTTPPEEVKGNTESAPSATNRPAGADATAPSASADATALALARADERIAILVVHADIKSISDLANKVIAINEVPSAYSAADIKSAIVAAGAAGVQMSENQTMALTRLIDGDVQAAIATVVSPTGADAWNSFPGFRVLRVPLPSASEKEKRG